MITLYLFSPVVARLLYVYLCPPTPRPSRPRPSAPASAPGCPRGRTARQAGRARRPAAGGKRRGRKAAGGPEKARRRTVMAAAAVRYELRGIRAEIPRIRGEKALTPPKKAR